LSPICSAFASGATEKVRNSAALCECRRGLSAVHCRVAGAEPLPHSYRRQIAVDDQEKLERSCGTSAGSPRRARPALSRPATRDASGASSRSAPPAWKPYAHNSRSRLDDIRELANAACNAAHATIQAHCKVAFIRHLAGFTPASNLMLAGYDVAAISSSSGCACSIATLLRLATG
jgi:hypothetical protein